MIIQRKSVQITTGSYANCLAEQGYLNLIVLETKCRIIYSSVSIQTSDKMQFILKSYVIEKDNSKASYFQSIITIADDDLTARAYITNLTIRLIAKGQSDYYMDATFCRYFDKRWKRMIAIFKLDEESIMKQLDIEITHIKTYQYRLKPIDYHRQQESNKIQINLQSSQEKYILIQNNIKGINNFLKSKQDNPSNTIFASFESQFQKEIQVQVPFYSISIALKLRIQNSLSQVHILANDKMICNIKHQVKTATSHFFHPGIPSQHILYLHNHQLYILHLKKILQLFQSSKSKEPTILTPLLQLQPTTKIALGNKFFHIVNIKPKQITKIQIIKLDIQNLNKFYDLFKISLLMNNYLLASNKSIQDKNNKNMIEMFDNVRNPNQMKANIYNKSISLQKQVDRMQKQLTQSYTSLKDKRSRLRQEEKIIYYKQLLQQISTNNKVLNQLAQRSKKRKYNIQEMIPQQYKMLNISQDKQLAIRQMIENDLRKKILSLKEQIQQIINDIL